MRYAPLIAYAKAKLSRNGWLCALPSILLGGVAKSKEVEK